MYFVWILEFFVNQEEGKKALLIIKDLFRDFFCSLMENCFTVQGSSTPEISNSYTGAQEDEFIENASAGALKRLKKSVYLEKGNTSPASAW